MISPDFLLFSKISSKLKQVCSALRTHYAIYCLILATVSEIWILMTAKFILC